MDLDDIRAINQAAAHLDIGLDLSPTERHALAMKLFAIAGNPMPDTLMPLAALDAEPPPGTWIPFEALRDAVREMERVDPTVAVPVSELERARATADSIDYGSLAADDRASFIALQELLASWGDP